MQWDLAALGLVALLAVGCSSTATHAPPAVPASPPVTVPLPPPTASGVPDAVPRIEPRSRYGNPPYYDVFGKRYYVLSSSAAYVERGVASWYGPGFHTVRTSMGESYDMYAMTAAHKTLPLPAYVRVTNLVNGRSVIVRVNDRGPFVGNRIIDLSYTAASKLDMLRNGTAMVEVRAIDPAAPITTPGIPLLPRATDPVAPPHLPLYVQAGAFADPANAERLAATLRGGGYANTFVRDDIIAGRRMYRVRVGPVANVPQFDRIVASLEKSGVHDAHLALD